MIGFGLSMSSTALVLQLLAERGQLNSQSGRSAFSILLFQDVAVLPALALLPLLGPAAAKTEGPGKRRRKRNRGRRRQSKAAA